MNVWSDAEARQRNDEMIQKKYGSSDADRRTGNGNAPATNSGAGRPRGMTETLFDAGVEEERHVQSLERPKPRLKPTPIDGFDDLVLSPASPRAPTVSLDISLALTVLQNVKSRRGFARHEYGKIHGALNPFYLDITKQESSIEPLAFRLYKEPEQQSQMLVNLKIFSLCDTSLGSVTRVEKLDSTAEAFESAILHEFEQAYDRDDVEKMRQYALVSIILDGGIVATDSFISRHSLVLGTQKLANAEDCVDGVAYGHVDLSPCQRFFERLAAAFVEQSRLIDQVFPPTIDVLMPFLTRISETLIQDFINVVLDLTLQKSRETYVKAVSGLFQQCMRFSISLQPTKGSAKTLKDDAQALLLRCFEPHIARYLAEELEFFKTRSEGEVTQWERDLSEEEARAESFFMSNINRQAAKRDFLSSFKKVVMMPVNALPAFPSSRSAVPPSAVEALAEKSLSRSHTPTPSQNGFTPTLSQAGFPHRVATPPVEAPTTELAAKTAIMNSRLESIKSLFSIEVALNLVHYAKASIERCAVFAKIKSSPFARPSQIQCEQIFIQLLHILGQQHIKPGFDKAVMHLTSYNPREVKELRSQRELSNPSQAAAVEPLVTFLELVNVGDLIQQMVDVFYAQELVATHLTERDDFLNPAGKEKKRFEQMLDERVAAGMGKGIDVLMDEVEFICATTQLATDFNPEAASTGKGPRASGLAIVDIGTSSTAKLVVETISSHTGMLVGSTDKHMLDVFNQEVGLRLFGAVCKHIKRQRISVDGAIKLIRYGDSTSRPTSD